jgi:hypothetical protein
MHFTTLLLCALATTAPARPATEADTIPYTLCPGVPSVIAVKKLSYDPNPPRINKPLTVIASGDLSTTITQGAKMVVTAKLGVLTVAVQTYDICAESAKSGIPCPIAPGLHDLKSMVEMPAGVQVPPFVTINIQARAYNGDGSGLFCFDTVAKFLP